MNNEMENRNMPSDFESFDGPKYDKTIDQIKDCHAINLGYNSFRDLVLNPKQDMKINHINWCVERSMIEYAEQEIKKFKS